MSDFQTIPHRFINRGLVLKMDPGSVGEGQFYQLENCYTLQEGALASRTGHQRLGSYGIASRVHSLGKLHISSTDASNPRYIGSGASIIRTTDSANIASGISLTSGDSWGYEAFKTGSSGRPIACFATTKGVFQDPNGVVSRAQRWGIPQPKAPAIAKPDVYTLHDLGLIAGSAARFTATTISSCDAGTGALKITPVSMDGIIAGMLLTIGGESTIVEGADNTAFYAVCAIAHAGGDAISASCTSVAVDTGTTSAAITGLAVDGSFDGLPDYGYDSDDVVHVSFHIADPTVISEIRFQIVPNYVGMAFSTDYYEKAISSNQLTDYLGTVTDKTNTTASEAAAAIRKAIDDGSYASLYPNYQWVQTGPDPWDMELINVAGDYLSSPSGATDAQSGVQPYEATASLPSATSEAWTEIDIPKSEFLKVGNAGNGQYTWKNINQVYVYVVATGATTVKVGNIYLAGGKGPGSAGGVLTDYRWAYSYRNPITGEESTVSVIQTVANTQNRPKRQCFKITCAGLDNSASSGHEEITGPGSIAVYRAGGALAANIYLRVGLAANPGVGSTVDFIDSAADTMIVSAEPAYFDNDPPVTSSLPIALHGNIVSFGGAATSTVNTVNRINLTALPTYFGLIKDHITVGSRIQVGRGLTAEQAVVTAIPTDASAYVDAVLQNLHGTYTDDPNEVVDCGSAVGVACDLVTSAHDSLFLAGDVNNPHVLYRSKTGQSGAFPVVNRATGNAHQINVGSPANPIMGIDEWNGEVVCLNLSMIYMVRVFMGKMEEPMEAPVNHGLIAKRACCKAAGVIYYLSYDGIYSWAGGAETKISEVLIPMFSKQTVNGVYPIDMSRSDEIRFAFSRNSLFVTYFDTAGSSKRLRYEVLYDRWCIESCSVADFTCAYTEEDTGNAIFAAQPAGYGTGQLWWYDFYSTSDGWVASTSDGAAITYGLRMYSALGQPPLDMLIKDVVLEYYSADATPLVGFCKNYNGTPDESFNLPIAGSRSRAPRPLNSGDGYECYAYGVSITGTTKYGAAFYSFTLRAAPLQEIQRGGAYDWDDLGHPYDKKLLSITLEYETEVAQSVVVYLDTLTGISGNTTNTAVASFTITGGKGKQTFAIPDTVAAAKMVKVRPAVVTVSFKMWKYTFQKEDYPPDFTSSTPWSDYGTPYDKYWQQLLLDVDTGGVVASVAVEVDGIVKQFVSVTSTYSTRAQVITLDPGIKGKKGRIKPTAGGGGKFQLFAHDFIVLPADKGPVLHTYDWDRLGHDHDKRLSTVTIEYEVSANTTMILYGLRGLAGAQTGYVIAGISLVASGRCLDTIAMPNDTIVKMVRFQPTATNVVFKSWKYTFQQENYPPDTIPATGMSNCGYPYEKVFQSLEISLDTGSVACSLGIEIDGTVQHTASVTTTSTDRSRIISIPSDKIGFMARVIPTPGAGGKAQIFEHQFLFQKEPPYLTHLDSSEQAFSFNGWRWTKQIWLKYYCLGAMTVKIYRDGGELFYSAALPAHTKRDEERFYLPAVYSGALNKSKVYRYVIDAVDPTKPFKLYLDASRVEWMPVAGDQRQGYQQMPFSTMIPLE